MEEIQSTTTANKIIINMKKIFAFLLSSLIFSTQAQTFIKYDDDDVETEYIDGQLWAYRTIENIVVGITLFKDNDGYGKNYQMLLYIKNWGYNPIVFFPEDVYSFIETKKGYTIDMEVYTYEEYIRKVQRRQNWAMALTGISAGLNAGSAGYSTSYSTSYTPYGTPYTKVTTHYNPAAAAAANMAAQVQIATLGQMMTNDRIAIKQNYMKTNTISYGESVAGYMNIKRRRGEIITINIPLHGKTFSFDWDVSKL